MTAPSLEDLVRSIVREEISKALSSPAPANDLQPLAKVAAGLGMSRRHLRALCVQSGVAIGGTRKRQVVDPVAVREALAGQRTRPRADAALVADLVRRRTGT